MDLKAPAAGTPASSGNRSLIIRAVAQAVIFPALLVFILFIPAGTFKWPMAWILMAVYLGGMLLTNLWLVVRHTGLAWERLVIPHSSEKLDLTLTKIANVLLLAVVLPLSGWDYRLGWSRLFPIAVSIAALILFAVMIGWSMSVNDFFSSAVRLQNDRGQTVATGGPYRRVRHPGYLAMILQFLAIPVILGSLWALIPAFSVAAVYVYRINREENFLLEKLPGNAEYARRVPYRLIPGIW